MHILSESELIQHVTSGHRGVHAAVHHLMYPNILVRKREFIVQYPDALTFDKELRGSVGKESEARKLIEKCRKALSGRNVLDLCGGSVENKDAPTPDSDLALPWGPLVGALLGANVTNIDIGEAVPEHTDLYKHIKANLAKIFFGKNINVAKTEFNKLFYPEGSEDTDPIHFFHLVIMRGVMSSANLAQGFWEESGLRKGDVDKINELRDSMHRRKQTLADFEEALKKRDFGTRLAKEKTRLITTILQIVEPWMLFEMPIMFEGDDLYTSDPEAKQDK